MLIGGTILSGCLLAVLSFCTLARFSLTVGFLPTAEDNTAYATQELGWQVQPHG